MELMFDLILFGIILLVATIITMLLKPKQDSMSYKDWFYEVLYKITVFPSSYHKLSLRRLYRARLIGLLIAGLIFMIVILAVRYLLR